MGNNEVKKDKALRIVLQELNDKADAKYTSAQDKIVNRRWLRIAAMFAGVLLLSGIAFATIYFVKGRESRVESQTTMANGQRAMVSSSDSAIVEFDEVRLDSILSVVSAHYAKAVNFLTKEAKDMNFFIEWKPEAPLADFIDELNMFDGLQLTLQQDTIFVELQEEKEDA